MPASWVRKPASFQESALCNHVVEAVLTQSGQQLICALEMHAVKYRHV
jgi:hypothetical protein